MRLQAAIALSCVEAAWAKEAGQALRAPMNAGGPGSGRHPAYGTFKEGGRAGDNWYYHGDGNHMVRVQDREDKHGATKVFEGRPGSKETQVFKAYRKGSASQNNDYHDFMRERYGIG